MQFLWLDIFQWKYKNFLELIKNPTEKTLVFTPNPEILVRANSDIQFLEILKKATHNTPDANGLYVGSMMQEGIGFFRAGFTTFFHGKQMRKKYGELIKGSDLTRDLLEYAWKNKQKILVLDNRVENIRSIFDQKKSAVQQNLKWLLEEKYPGITVQVIFSWDMANDGIAHLIELQHISYVFSCLGMKTQEQALIDIWHYLPMNQQVVWLGVGASIDFLLGLQKRAPQVFQKLGIEWLYRLILEPRKRWKRIYTAVVEFPMMIKNTSK
jgi:N-acetylglucosaminyldiphosphoundecaprenol N-acetyl-beta-D-mannosaminyltransferase